MAMWWMLVCDRLVKSITISDTVDPCDLCTVSAEAGHNGNCVLATSLFLPTVNLRISGTIGVHEGSIPGLYLFLQKACVLFPISLSSKCTQMTPLAFLSGGTSTYSTVQLAPFVKPSAVLAFRTISYFKPNAMCNSLCNCIAFRASVGICINNALLTSADTDSTTQSMALISHFSVCTLRYMSVDFGNQFVHYRGKDADNFLFNLSYSSESTLVNRLASKLLSDSVRFPSSFDSVAGQTVLHSSNIIAYCCHKVVAGGAYPVVLFLNINEWHTGFKWNKSPTNVTEIPPKSHAHPMISHNR